MTLHEDLRLSFQDTYNLCHDVGRRAKLGRSETSLPDFSLSAHFFLDTQPASKVKMNSYKDFPWDFLSQNPPTPT